MHSQTDTPAPIRPLLTGSQGYPELERLFLGAEHEIWAGFRVFDLDTALRSEAGRAIGATWFDLIVHRLRAGVAIHFLLADFDPHLATELHRASWRSVHQFRAAAEQAGPAAKLEMRAVLHPAHAGALPRVFFWPMVLRKLGSTLRKATDPAEYVALATRLSDRVIVAPGGAVRVRPSPIPQIFPATLHQKLAVFDRSRLFIGGLDLNERRYDDLGHRRSASQTWQDVSVSTEGPAARAAQAHLESLWAEDGPARLDPIPAPAPAFVRTQSRDGSLNPFRLAPVNVLREIELAHYDLFRSARRLIYIETQYFRYPPIARALARAAKERPDLTLVMMLPAAPDDVAFEGYTGLDARFGEYLQARCLRMIRRAFGKRAFVGMPLRPVARDSEGRDTALGSEIIYIHSKVAIADDTTAIVSSANLNGRSLRWDTEAGLVIRDAVAVADLRRNLFAHWLPEHAPAETFDPETAVQAWRDLAARNARSRPWEREGFIAPYDRRPAEKFGTDVPLIPQELV